MSKVLKNSNLTSRPAARTLVAISLSLSLAAFGCTTDRTLGNGDPVTTPGLRTSPTGGTSSGSESTPSVPPSMTSSSSYVGAQAIPSGTQRMRRLSAAEAAAVMAQHTPRVRYLGVAYPGNNSGSATSTVVTGQFQNPALITNPQRTLNSSISSQPTTAISSGQGEAVGSTGGGITSAAVINGTSLGTTGTADTTGAAAVFSPTAVSGTGVPFGTINTTLSPTVSPTAFSSVTPTGAVAGFPALTAPATATQATTATTATTTATTSATTSATANATVTASNATSATTANRVASPVRIVRNANGRAVITNATTTSNGRNR